MSPTSLHGPTEVNSGSWYTYYGGSAPGATSYEWLLPYPFMVNNPIDQTSDYWQTWPTESGYNPYIWTGNGGINGKVQLVAKNKCGTGGSKHIDVVHDNSGGPCTTCDFGEPIPNPSNSEFTIYNPNNVNVNSLKIYDIYSNLVLEINNLNQNSAIDTNSFEEGIYFIHIVNETEIVIKSLLVEH